MAANALVGWGVALLPRGRGRSRQLLPVVWQSISFATSRDFIRSLFSRPPGGTARRVGLGASSPSGRRARRGGRDPRAGRGMDSPAREATPRSRSTRTQLREHPPPASSRRTVDRPQPSAWGDRRAERRRGDRVLRTSLDARPGRPHHGRLRAYRSGLGCLFEHLRRLPAERPPTYFAIYPGWFPYWRRADPGTEAFAHPASTRSRGQRTWWSIRRHGSTCGPPTAPSSRIRRSREAPRRSLDLGWLADEARQQGPRIRSDRRAPALRLRRRSEPSADGRG
jgi:hypothetical protein